MSVVWRWYLRMLRDHTLPTQMVTGGCIGCIADSLAQRTVEKRSQQDVKLSYTNFEPNTQELTCALQWKRTGRQTIYSFAVFAPMANKWFSVLQRINFNNIYATALARTGVDMVTFMPFASMMFFGCIGTMEGRSFAEIKHRWSTNFPKVIKAQYATFVPAQLINMVVLPLYARPPFLNCIGLGWTLYLATVNSQTPAYMPIPIVSAGSEKELIRAVEIGN